MISVAFFNNKGGVGKTTLACNVGASLAIHHKRRVLLIDCDPQCNSTQLILPPEACIDLYELSKPPNSTLIDAVQPMKMGDAHLAEEITPILGSSNRFELDLLAGHPLMSEFEDQLGEHWSKMRASEVGSFRRTNWAYALLQKFHRTHDVAIFDLGPSLGALNRSVLLACDMFLTPMGCDIFSILGIRNMGEWIRNWIKDYERSLGFLTETNKDALKEYPIADKISIKEGYVGYTVLQYITKSKEGERRPTEAFEQILAKIPSEIEKSLGEFHSPRLMDEEMKLGDIPHMFSLVPLAQTANAPIVNLSYGDGLVGGQYSQQKNYTNMINDVVERIKENIGA